MPLLHFDSVAFLTMVQNCAGDSGPPWGDEFLRWYDPRQWINEHRGCAAFLGRKFAAAKDGAGSPGTGTSVSGTIAAVGAFSASGGAGGSSLFDTENPLTLKIALAAMERELTASRDLIVGYRKQTERLAAERDTLLQTSSAELRADAARWQWYRASVRARFATPEQIDQWADVNIASSLLEGKGNG